MENHDITEPSFAELLEEQAKEQARIQDGKRAKGIVITSGPEKIVVNINYKADAFLLAEEYTAENMYEEFKPGDEVEWFVKTRNDGDGNVLLTLRSPERGERRTVNPLFLEEENWKDKEFDAEIKEVVKGGVSAIVENTRVFIPASMFITRFGRIKDLGVYVGRTLKVKIIEVKLNGAKTRASIIASAKEAVEAEEEVKVREALSTLETGKIIHGKVTHIVSFGAFIDLGIGYNLEGLLPTSYISWSTFDKISDVITEGEEIDVIVLNVDLNKYRVSLGRKQLLPKPWANADERYIVGSIVEGKVTTIYPSGALVELEPTIRGFVHISNIAPRRVESIEDEIKVGDTVRVKVLSVDMEAKHIALSRKDAILDENPEIAAEFAKAREEREKARAEQREAFERQKKARQQAQEERNRRNEQRRERNEQRSENRHHEDVEYTVTEQEHSTTSLASLLQGFKAEDDE